MNNWQQMIEALEQRGLSKRDIATRCGMAYSTFCELARGDLKEPTGMRAVKLHALFREVCGEQQAAA